MDVILVPVDFSDRSFNAAVYAAELCRGFNAKLILFHAYTVQVSTDGAGILPPVSELRLAAEREVKAIKDRLSLAYPQLDISYKVALGEAAIEIQEMSEKEQADLIVMGITGQNKFLKEHVIGSTSVRVARHSGVPVLIVPPNSVYAGVRKMAYACDLSDDVESGGSLPLVKYFCRLFDAELEVLTVFADRNDMTPGKAHVDHYVEEKLASTRHNSFLIYEKNVHTGLIDYLNLHKADIIVTCPKKHSVFRNLFMESHTNKLVFHSPVPVLCIHN